MLTQLLFCALFLAVTYEVGLTEQSSQGSELAIGSGSVGVVISTTEGFVLATDSRLKITTGAGTRYSDDAQKLFPIGTHTACVVAGLQGLKVGSGVLRPADAIGTTLLSLDRSASTERITAEDIATNFYYAMKGLGELGTWPHDEPSQKGDLSVVSINPDETYDWISLSVPLTATEKRTARPLSAGTPTYSIRTTRRPLHFDVDVIGQRAIAYRLLQANSADWDSHSRSDIMTQYYRLKSAGQLDHCTRSERLANLFKPTKLVCLNL